MTVSELIEKLKACDPNAPVYLERDEGGNMDGGQGTWIEDYRRYAPQVCNLETRVVIDFGAVCDN